ncbi:MULTISPECIES: hypothetical protein [unclassified Sphingomonas]|uniref:hypothetical protein n=1 Tax=unclassified Sphingomonas TaxID=196159 RepID=UPI00215102C6|nr:MULTISPECIES: hypothetical protein [unclassified Sphingomonas]MCR5871595.1 hypothetical protein [Sphingomonas sp. J344]UUY00111.1 hypothetical protein LRS08_02970 [Sphingomonas sp. J315]
MAVVESVPITKFARARRKIVDHFCAQHAVTPLDTIIYTPPAELKPVFDKLIAQRVIRREGQGYYWLDLRVLDAVILHHRRKYVPVAIVVAVLLAIVAMAFYTDIPIGAIG